MRPFLSIIKILICALLYSGFAFSQQHSEKLLARTWKIDKLSISGMIIKADKKQRGDYLDLNTDATFTRVDEGIHYKGTWTWEKEQQRIKLVYQENQQKVFFKVKKIEGNQLILKMEEDWKNEMLMYFSAAKFPCSI